LNRNTVFESLLKYLRSEKELPEADAAVCILLKKRDIDVDILFVKRTVKPFDPWSGEMAFPGGRKDRRDKNIKVTLVREIFEETGIDLENRCRFLGTMELFRSTRNKKLRILPFVVFIEYEPSIMVNNELEWSVWIPLEDLIQHEGVAIIESKEVPAFIMENCIIWGLTYRILRKFIDQLQSFLNES
jgi:8-oxo-dGTP pyrophosphatase MutT (NUDIX family)